MPEGHTIHRHARIQMRDMGGRALSVSSPQGWAADAAAEVDGRVLERIDAYGKHMLYRFEGALPLHVHLGLFGKFRRLKEPAPPPRDTTRLRFEGGDRVVDLAGATASELMSQDAEAALLARLGPDPLRRDAHPERAREALTRRRIGIGAALMDQKVIAGIGNVYRAEILFACGLDPLREARSITDAEFDCIWSETVSMMRRGARSGKIVTVPASEAGGKQPSRLTGQDRMQVYRRERCRRCGGPVSTAQVAGRTLYWCPNDQA